MSQYDAVMMYIHEHGHITRYEAMLELGIANLTAVISVLRKRGKNIVTQMVSSKNRYGDPVQYACYILGYSHGER